MTTCITLDCQNPVAGPGDPIPGTNRFGSVYWCVACEAARIKRIDETMRDIEESMR